MSPKRIELVGSPGVGKSTLMRALILKRSTSYSDAWRDQNLICLFGESKIVNSLLIYLLYANNGFSYKLYKLASWLNRSILLSKGNLNGNSLGDDMLGVVNSFTLICSKYIKPSRIVDVSSLFFEMLIAIEYLRKLHGKKVVFFDEGFAQQVFSLAYSGVPNDELIDHINTTPPPNLLLVVTADYQTIDQRLKKRDGPNSRYLDKQDIAERAMRMCIDSYSARGTKILHFDATDYSPEDLANLFNSIDGS